METWRRWKARKDPAAQEYHRVSRRDRVAIASVYLGLAGLLALGMDATFVEREIGDA
jgi:hypothetical protein